GRLADVTRVLSDTRLDLPEPSVGTGRPLGMLPAHAAARLTSLVAGPHAGRVRLPQGGDTELVGRLFRAVTRSRLGCVPPALLWDGPELARSDALTDSVDLALELSKKPVAAESLQRIEGLAAIPERLGLAAARALARQGETFRALTLLERLDGSIEVYLLAADLERRRGASANADQWLGRIGEAQPQGEALLCYLALQA